MHLRLILILCTVCLATNAVAEPPKVRFEKIQLDSKFRSEGVAVADINRDGKLDVAAGFVWYAAPDWKLHAVAEKAPSGRSKVLGTPLHFEPKGYANAFANFADDLNGDGWPDLMVVDFPGTQTWWYENPGKQGGDWPQHLLTPVTNNESPAYTDIDGDGQSELIAAVSPDPKQPDGPDRKMAIITRGEQPTDEWNVRTISAKAAAGTKRYSHGLGTGDVNGDGRLDVVCAEGWWQAPENADAEEWIFHPAPFGGKAAQMFVYDFDDDGDNDVLSSSPHAYGLWWHEQTAPGKWKQHEIDKTFSQLHGVCFADINGDDLPDIITGKRWWAHNGRDPGGNDPAVFFWYELSRQDGKPVWTPHQFDHSSGPGTQFEVSDVDGDGLLDIVTSNKKGVHLFLQKRD